MDADAVTVCVHGVDLGASCSRCDVESRVFAREAVWWRRLLQALRKGVRYGWRS